MPKITADLSDTARHHPEQTFRVVVVHVPGTVFAADSVKNHRLLMDNISCMELSGRDLLLLEENESVESVEPDSSVSIR